MVGSDIVRILFVDDGDHPGLASCHGRDDPIGRFLRVVNDEFTGYGS